MDCEAGKRAKPRREQRNSDQAKGQTSNKGRAEKRNPERIKIEKIFCSPLRFASWATVLYVLSTFVPCSTTLSSTITSK